MLCSVFVTAQTEQAEELSGEVADALAAIGLAVERHDGALMVDGQRFVVALVDRAHPTPAALAQIVADAPPRRPAMVIADRISEPGRDVLRQAGWGWLDRRGHLRLWTTGVRIEAPVPGMGDDGGRATGNPWTTVGLEIAVATLLAPTEPVSSRGTAATIGRSVGAVHELIDRFTGIGLIGAASRLPLLPELFWETAAHWPDDDWVGVPVDLAAVATRVGTDALVRVDERAATLGGARIAAAGDLPPRAYVPTTRLLRRVRALADRNVRSRSWVRAAPVRFLPTDPDHPADGDHPWLIAHPIICALRLAADPARGREIVEDWGIVPTGDPA